MKSYTKWSVFSNDLPAATLFPRQHVCTHDSLLSNYCACERHRTPINCLTQKNFNASCYWWVCFFPLNCLHHSFLHVLNILLYPVTYKRFEWILESGCIAASNADIESVRRQMGSRFSGREQDGNNWGGGDVNGRWQRRRKLNIFSFMPSSAMEFTATCHIAPQMPHFTSQYDWYWQWDDEPIILVKQ